MEGGENPVRIRAKEKYALLQFTRLIAFIKLGFTTFEARHNIKKKKRI